MNVTESLLARLKGSFSEDEIKTLTGAYDKAMKIFEALPEDMSEDAREEATIGLKLMEKRLRHIMAAETLRVAAKKVEDLKLEEEVEVRTFPSEEKLAFAGREMEIFEKAVLGESKKSLAEHYGVSESRIRDILQHNVRRFHHWRAGQIQRSGVTSGF